MSAVAVRIDAGAAERVLLELELPQLPQHFERWSHDLRADPVSGQRDDAMTHRLSPSAYSAVVATRA